jgi:hypothetical protein
MNWTNLISPFHEILVLTNTILQINSASTAQKKYYYSTTAAQRGAILRKWFDLVIANKADRRFTDSKRKYSNMANLL